MSDDQVLTFEELETRLYAREEALRARDLRLALPFLILLALAGVLVVVAALELPAPMDVLRAGAAVVLTGLATLGGYVLATTRNFRRRYEVACPHCGSSLAALREWIDLPVPAADAAPELHCPDCEGVVAAGRLKVA